LDLVKSVSVFLRRRVISESVLALQFIKSLFHNLSKRGLRFEFEGSTSGGVGDIGEEFAIRSVAAPADWNANPRILTFVFEAGGVDLRPTLLRFPNDLLRIFDRPILRKIAIKRILAVAYEQNDFVSAPASESLEESMRRPEEIRVLVGRPR